MWLCSPIRILAVTRDGDQRRWGILLMVKTPDGHWHRCALPRTLAVISGDEVFGFLTELGLRFAATRLGKAALRSFILRSLPIQRALCVARTGWHGRAFVLPDAVIGDTQGEEIVLQPCVQLKHAYRVAGTLDGWRQKVARLAQGNSRLVFTISAAFAPPLLQLMETEGGGAHLRGSSSTGKSTAANAAGSVWGGGGIRGYAQSWRATDNALESVALGHCDAFLILDEMGEAKAEVVSRTAYMLANGVGKLRANRTGDARPPAEWCTLFLSTGEVGLSEILAEDGRTVRAGQEVRVVDIPADAGAGNGIFENLQGFNRAADLADAIRKASREEYGHPSREFLRKLTADLEGVRAHLCDLMQRFLVENLPPKRDGQVERIGRRFAVVAAAGELASKWGVTGWQPGEATNAAAKCFTACLDQRGGADSLEALRAVNQVRAFLQRHGQSQFVEWSQDLRVVPDRGGFWRNINDGVQYYVYPDFFRRKICIGLDSAVAAKALAARGYLERDAEGNPTRTERLPDKSRTRVYVINGELLNDNEGPGQPG
jgi:uncharacterized protein (DUF927 family)